MVDIRSDDHYETGPLGEIVDPCVLPLVASPYSAPNLQVIDPSDSFSARTDLTLDGFGPITLGMTTEEAADVSGLAIVNDPDHPLERGCWLAIVAHDPYSPSFTMEERDGESTIVYVTTSYPLNRTRTIGLSTALVSPRCSGNLPSEIILISGDKEPFKKCAISARGSSRSKWAACWPTGLERLSRSSTMAYIGALGRCR